MAHQSGVAFVQHPANQSCLLLMLWQVVPAVILYSLQTSLMLNPAVILEWLHSVWFNPAVILEWLHSVWSSHMTLVQCSGIHPALISLLIFFWLKDWKYPILERCLPAEVSAYHMHTRWHTCTSVLLHSELWVPCRYMSAFNLQARCYMCVCWTFSVMYHLTPGFPGRDS